MKIDIEDIKALESGKIYAVSVDLSNIDVVEATVETLTRIGKDWNLRFLFLAKDTAEFISVPEGIEVNLSGVEAYQLMEEEMMAFLERTYSKDDAPPETLLVTELGRIFQANKDHVVKNYAEAFSDSSKWPDAVTDEQLLSIVHKWRVNLPKS